MYRTQEWDPTECKKKKNKILELIPIIDPSDVAEVEKL